MLDIKQIKRIWSKVCKGWAAFGLIALIAFIGWCLLGYRANPDARQALHSSQEIQVVRGDGYWSFISRINSNPPSLGLLFFPGSLVEPAAYAPLARAVARKGYPVLLVELPRRGTFGGANGHEIIKRARKAMQQVSDVPHWIVSGHSRGGAVAACFVQENASGVAGLVLVGTTHPREYSLVDLQVPVMKILGTWDGLATVEKAEQTRHNLPASTRWIVIQGVNHSQFGCYGFQPGDHKATISRDQQQKLTTQAFIEMLESVKRTISPTSDDKTNQTNPRPTSASNPGK